MRLKKPHNEVQQAYRERKKATSKRLDTLISNESADQLSTLVGYHDTTKAKLLEQLIDKAYRSMQRKIEREREHGEVYFGDRIDEEVARLEKREKEQVAEYLQEQERKKAEANGEIHIPF